MKYQIIIRTYEGYTRNFFDNPLPLFKTNKSFTIETDMNIEEVLYRAIQTFNGELVERSRRVAEELKAKFEETTSF